MTTLHRYAGLRRHPTYRAGFVVLCLAVAYWWTVIPLLVLEAFALVRWIRLWADRLVSYRAGALASRRATPNGGRPLAEAVQDVAVADTTGGAA